MLITTTNEIAGRTVKECLGICKGSTVKAKHIGKDILAAFKQIIGGEIKQYTEMMEESRELATQRMIQDAEKMGANAILAFRLQTSMVMQGASEIIAYGTAVIIE